MLDINTRLKILEEIKAKCNWLPGYNAIFELINEIDAKQIIEIGVAYGYHCEYILEKNKNIKYIGIDPYKCGYDENDIFAKDVKDFFTANSEQEGLDVLYDTVIKKLSKYESRFKFYRNSSAEINDKIENDSIDLIYIDGDHTYEGVMKDLNFSWNKIKKQNSILCGDDYSWSGVKRACDDFFNSKNIQYSTFLNNASTCWVCKF